MNADVLADARWIGPHGIGRFAEEVLRRLPLHERIEKGPRPLSAWDPLWTEWQARRRRPRVYFSPGFNPPPRCAAPLVFTIHDLLQIQMPEVATPAKRAYYAAIVRPASRRSFCVLTVSEYSRAQILDWAGLPNHRVVNVGNGVGAPFVAGGERHNPGYPYIFYAGNFRRHKNLDRLFTAFRDLRQGDVRLFLTGVADRAILRRVEAYGVPARTQFTGRVDDIQLARLYRGAELVVQPSLCEGFGLTALEAMACGAPVVASRAGALAEIAGPAAVLVDPFDTASLRMGMERVLSDPELRLRLRCAGMQRARRFTWDAVASRVRGVLVEAGARFED